MNFMKWSIAVSMQRISFADVEVNEKFLPEIVTEKNFIHKTKREAKEFSPRGPTTWPSHARHASEVARHIDLDLSF